MRECRQHVAAKHGSSSCRLLLNLLFVTRDYQKSIVLIVVSGPVPVHSKEDPQTLKNLLLALTPWGWGKRDFFAIAQEERLSCPASSATSNSKLIL